jgi:hypothetical protein
MVDNQENILVEFDYNNIIVVDPNKVVDSDGKAQERLVKHENLVIYANLECEVLPRTKLATGVATNDSIQTISVAKINFLNPGGKTFLDNSYTDEITGKDSIKGEGVNQPKKESIKNPNRDNDFYIRQTINSKGVEGSIDNGLLGIVSINIRQNTSFMPVITVQLEDVKGRALFEGGSNSPYAAFFNLPYPLFHLTIKGYYGKAVRLPLMLQNFTSRYDSYSGNFSIVLTFYTYKYTVLTEVTMGALQATPHMYKSRLNIQTTSGNASQFSTVEDVIYERGYQKIKELYGEYKSKGLIPNDFPEITVIQMNNRIENFIKNTLDSFTKQNLDPLTDLDTYQNQLIEYRKDIYYAAGTSWFEKYMDTKNFFILNDKNKTKIYPFKQEFNSPSKRNDAISKLKGEIEKYNKLLNENKTVGLNGSYVINNNIKEVSIPNNVKYDIFPISINGGDIDIIETYRKRKSVSQATEDQLKQFTAQLEQEKTFNSLEIEIKGDPKTQVNNGPQTFGGGTSPSQPSYFYYKFEGNGNFIDLTDKMLKDLKTKKEQIQDELTKALSNLLQSKNNGIGFVPTIRNVLAVIFANGEAFLRLMDEVHRKAWDVRNEKERKEAILNTQIATASPDNPNLGEIEKTPIYPWPQYIVETNGENGQEKYEVAYPGDSQYISQTKGYLFNLWPEVEFVEEFIKAYTERTLPPADPTENSNELTEPQRVSLNAIEFPITNEVFSNKEEVKFFYEIFERLFLSSNYTGLNRVVSNKTVNDAISSLIANTETENIIKSLSNDNPFIIKKLKEYGINSSNFELILRHFSNDGIGQSWQNFIRGIFNTSYIKNKVENSNFQVLNPNILNNEISQPQVSLEGEDSLVNLISNSTVSDDYSLVDTFPFTNLTWDKTFLANGINSIGNLKNSFSTKKVLTFNTDKKIISNFLGTDVQNQKRPITNFIFENVQVPSSYEVNLKTFFENRNFKTQLVTEGNISYDNYTDMVINKQTTSIFNTPYFINSIQEGVTNFRNSVQYPFVSSAYLFLNSLPLTTLKEKYKTYENGANIPLDYMFATFIKYGAIHKVPYAWILKMGSVWHRYKIFIETNNDILTNCWTDFNYANNFDPVNGNITTNYSLILNGAPIDIVLQKDATIGVETSTVINTGFYPKLINDFNVFYQGFQIYANFTNADLQDGFNSGVTINYIPNSVINFANGFDPNNPNRDLKIIPWSVHINTLDGAFSYVIPSQGALINQTKNECFKDDKLKIEVNNNPSMYNGSARLFWAAPNFGYFDNSKVRIPSPTEYLKKIINDNEEQENFSINGTSKGYSNIEEIFSVFDKEVLDYFETEFLNFSKSIYDFGAEGLPENITETQKSFRNFQMMMRNLMKLPKITSNPTTDLINEVQNNQVVNITNIIKDFLNYDVVFKYGNPLKFDKRLFYTFSNHQIVDEFTWRSYNASTPNALPSLGGITTLVQSKANYPAEWITLETYIGFSTITNLIYSNNGSYITDFFIDMDIEFTVQNIQDFAPIIRMYSTQKLIDNTLNKSKFIQLIENYLTSCDNFRNDIINNLIIRIQKLLPNVDSTTTNSQQFSGLEGPQTKVELWESFKATNDKWIAGSDLNTKTLFEDVLLLDRASRNVGDTIIVDIFKLKERINTINPTTNMLTFVQTILVENNFVVMNIPTYINFYNVQDASKNPIPKIEGSIEFANDLFGTFLNVDYRKSSSKMVCFYASKPSEHLDVRDNVDYRFRNDAFELGRSSDNPLIENQINKTDWDKSNKVVGFNIDIGPQNQSIFYGFQVGQNQGQSTAESLEVINQMANQAGNRAAATQNISLYNVYKNRSYTCTVSSMGNAMIQPTMYFNLRHVPMFSGPYMILSVNHNITPGKFETIFEGIRQPVYSLPKIDNYIQSLKVNLLQNIIEKNKQEKSKETKDDKGNVISEKDKIISNVNGGKTVDNTPTCIPNSNYMKYVSITPSIKKESFSSVKKTINQLLLSRGINDDGKLKYLIFVTLYLESATSTGFEAYENNFSGVDLGQNWGDSATYFGGEQYFCLSNQSTTLPYAIFDDLSNNITFWLERWKNRTSKVESITKQNVAKFWILNFGATQKAENVYSSYPSVDLQNLETKVQEAIDLFNSM